MASDITYDRSRIIRSLFADRPKWTRFFERYQARVDKAEAEGGSPPSITKYAQPAFLTFIRQPHCAAFTVLGQGGAPGIPFLGVNAHLLYGNGKRERKREFDALLDWLLYRAQARDRMYHGNMMLFGDLNLEFNRASVKRGQINSRLRAINNGELSDEDAAHVNFPLLTQHPDRHSLFQTNARQDQTYDQIALFISPDEGRLPTVPANRSDGTAGRNGYDYGVFRFTDLFAQALHGRAYRDLSEGQQDRLITRANADVSDHMPAWIRLSIPGA